MGLAAQDSLANLVAGITITRTPQLRLGVPVGIGYEEDIEEARRVLLVAVDGHPMILPDPAPKVVVKALGESAVELELRVWLRDAHAEREAYFAMVELVKKTLDEAEIEIPYPQRTVRFAGDNSFAEGRPVAVPERERARRQEPEAPTQIPRSRSG